jgi:hypothetical protein
VVSQIAGSKFILVLESLQVETSTMEAALLSFLIFQVPRIDREAGWAISHAEVILYYFGSVTGAFCGL